MHSIGNFEIIECIKNDREHKNRAMENSTQLLNTMTTALRQYEAAFQQERLMGEELLQRIKKDEEEKTGLLKHGISLLTEGIANNKKIIEELIRKEEEQIINELEMQINPK